LFIFIKQGAGTTEIVNRLITVLEAKKGSTFKKDSPQFEKSVHSDILEINSVRSIKNLPLVAP
jgi:hypothetical protein